MSRAAIVVMNTHDTPCTEQQRDAIVRASDDRVRYISWIADKLLETDDALIRKEASKLLKELTSK